MSDPGLIPQSIGWYGKLPARGDFVGQGIPRNWLRTWDDWLTRALALAVQQHGGDWRERLLGMRPWQCIVQPEQPGGAACCGVVAASEDRIGRAFPLLLFETYEPAALRAADLADCQARGEMLARWLSEAIRTASPETLDAGLAPLAATPWPVGSSGAGGQRAGIGRLFEQQPAAQSFWWPADAASAPAYIHCEEWPPRESLLLDWLAV